MDKRLEYSEDIKISKKPTILCLNDDQSMLSFLSRGLESANFKCVATSDSVEALSILKKGNVQLLIQDISRPDMNGLEFYLMMKRNEKTSKIPVFIISAWEPLVDERKSEFISDGMHYREKILLTIDLNKKENILELDGFLSLPFDMDELITKIKLIIP